jgi:energy-coupling factor transport system ATP-binding protein
MNLPEIKIRDLSFVYPTSLAPALNNLDLEVYTGEWISIMGPTGAGKSTLSLCLNGLIPNMQPGTWEGKVTICGDETTQASIPHLSSKVGVLFQDFNTQLFSSQVELELAFAMENLCVPRESMKKRVEDLLHQFDLLKYTNSHPAELSGGERQRLAIASVLALCPRVLVLDEPTTDLDPFNRAKLLSIVKEMHKDGLTILWIDHKTELSFESSRFIVMDKGEIARDTTFRDFFSKRTLAEKYSIKQPDIPCLFKNKVLQDTPIIFEEALEALRKHPNGPQWKLSKEKQKRYISEKKATAKVIMRAEDLEYIYPNGTKALKGINLDIREGEFIAIIGQNGSGKTTLAKHLNGLLKPAAGKAFIKGNDTAHQTIFELSKHVGFCFQNPDNQIFASSVLEEVSFGPKNYEFPPSRIHENVKKALEAVELSGFEDKDPFVLTKGERQRIAVASILSLRPEIMVFDEPTTGLDYAQMTRMMALIERLNKEGCTVIIITHSMWVAAQYARRCVVMAEGRILLDGETHEVFSKETILKKASLLPPDIVRLSNALGVTTLSVEEFMDCLE